MTSQGYYARHFHLFSFLTLDAYFELNAVSLPGCPTREQKEHEISLEVAWRLPESESGRRGGGDPTQREWQEKKRLTKAADASCDNTSHALIVLLMSQCERSSATPTHFALRRKTSVISLCNSSSDTSSSLSRRRE